MFNIVELDKIEDVKKYHYSQIDFKEKVLEDLKNTVSLLKR